MSVSKPKLEDKPVNSSEIIRAGSENPDAVLAASEIYSQLAHAEPECIFFYCSAEYRLDLLAKELAELFADTRLIGCTSAGEITPAGCKQNSIAAFSLPKELFSVESVLIKNLASFTAGEAEVLVNDMVQRLKEHSVAPLEQHSFALSLLDGLSIREELVLNALSSGLKDIPLVGGSAGDNLHFIDTQIYYDGEFHTNAAALALVNTVCPFKVFCGHHLLPKSDKLVVTSADPYGRVVHEFNAEPAALEYCRVNGLSIDDLGSETFAMHPLGVQVGDDVYIRSIQKLNEDLSLTFFCAIDVGVVLTRMKSAGLVSHIRSIFSDATQTLGSPELVIGYDCIHRRCEAEHFNQIDEMSELYAAHNVIGFNTYGEQRDDMHMNHTFTGVAIGAPDYDRD